jgi:type IV pilus assembly protein PilA
LKEVPMFNPSRGRRRDAGVSIIELMIVVAIMGIIAAAAIPSYVNYIKRSKTIEATMNIRKIYDATVAYHTSEHTDSTGIIQAKQWPAQEPNTPALGFCCASPGQKCAPTPSWWETPTWQALRFAVNDGHHYHYSFQWANPAHNGSAIGHRFQAQARGNLDCDAIYSQYYRTGEVDSQYGIRGAPGLYIALDIE